jgi:thiamine biosynthesis protein ThiS
MRLMVNGEKREVPDGTTVTQLLETLKIVPERVVVEVNLTILKRAEHPTAVLTEGDQVEIVHFVGGGGSDPMMRISLVGV